MDERLCIRPRITPSPGGETRNFIKVRRKIVKFKVKFLIKTMSVRVTCTLIFFIRNFDRGLALKFLKKSSLSGLKVSYFHQNIGGKVEKGRKIAKNARKTGKSFLRK